MNRDTTPQDMLGHADAIAKAMVKDMPEDEAIQMVRDFISVLADWQPTIANLSEDPTMLAITSLATTKLFELAFVKAYGYSARQVEAREAIEKALGDQS